MNYKEAVKAGFRDSITSNQYRHSEFEAVCFADAYREGWEMAEAFVKYDLSAVGRENMKVIIDSFTEDIREIPVPPGTHTVLIVKAEFERGAIGKFLNKLRNEGNAFLPTLSFNEIAAFAIGEYGIPVKDIFGDDDESKLSDAMLGKITKYRMKKENN